MLIDLRTRTENTEYSEYNAVPIPEALLRKTMNSSFITSHTLSTSPFLPKLLSSNPPHSPIKPPHHALRPPLVRSRLMITLFPLPMKILPLTYINIRRPAWSSLICCELHQILVVLVRRLVVRGLHLWLRRVTRVVRLGAVRCGDQARGGRVGVDARVGVAFEGGGAAAHRVGRFGGFWCR